MKSAPKCPRSAVIAASLKVQDACKQTEQESKDDLSTWKNISQVELLGHARIGRSDQLSLSWLVVLLIWVWSRLTMKGARIEAPDSRMTAGKSDRDNVGNDERHFWEWSDLAVELEVLVLATQDEWSSSRILVSLTLEFLDEEGYLLEDVALALSLLAHANINGLESLGVNLIVEVQDSLDFFMLVMFVCHGEFINDATNLLTTVCFRVSGLSILTKSLKAVVDKVVLGNILLHESRNLGSLLDLREVDGLFT